MPKDELFEQYWIYYIVALCVWPFIRRNAGQYFINKGLLEIMVVGLLFFSAEYMFWFYRYYMPHVVCNGFSGSILGRPKIRGDYAIFKCGEVTRPIHLEGNLHTLVLHIKTLKRVGKNYISTAVANKIPYIQLPEKVYREIYNNASDYNTNKIYIGEYSEEFIDDNIDLPDFIEEKKNLNRAINIRNKIIEGDNDLLIEQMKTARELGEESWYKKFLPKKKDKEEDE